MDLTREEVRLRDARHGAPWRFIGPYLSERQWGTVREDYSPNGDAWSYFSHDEARSRAYRWGEDGLAGQSDEHQRMCFALALWNEQDAIIKERLFGLTNAEGNHGEDVKEYYFYVDNVPTHSYQRWLYKYPQRPYPYADLIGTNRQRSRMEFEYELIDTGVFDDDRYFDVEVIYAKASEHDLVCRITVSNRGPDDAPLHLLPTLWFRNTWSFPPNTPKPSLRTLPGERRIVVAQHDQLGTWHLHAPDDATLLFCDNESNAARLWGVADSPPFPKDGIADHVLHGAATVNPEQVGTKASAHLRVVVPAGGSTVTWLRLVADTPLADPFADAADVVAARLAEADEFYDAITPGEVEAGAASVMRQALAGMLWSKQSYYFDLDVWLREHRSHPLRSPVNSTRNESWFHMLNHDVISMPDKWEYPWYAAWDLAFHCLPLAMVDPDFAQSQLDLMLTQLYLHPTGQMPAYEWNFGDVNPPVHAFATLFMHSLSGSLGDVDRPFLRQSFLRLLLNFTWWVNRKDPAGKNVFEGGFLGLDNIGVFDRSAPVPGGAASSRPTAPDGWRCSARTCWSSPSPCSRTTPTTPTSCSSSSSTSSGSPPPPTRRRSPRRDVGRRGRLLLRRAAPPRRHRSAHQGALVGRPAAVVRDDGDLGRRLRGAPRAHHAHRGVPASATATCIANIADPFKPGVNGRRLLSLVNEDKLRRILARMLDEERFLGPHGIRSISACPPRRAVRAATSTARATSCSTSRPSRRPAMFGGNSNWRGPVWFPINVLILRALLQHYRYYGDDFTIECPTGSGKQMTLFEVAEEIGRPADRDVPAPTPTATGRCTAAPRSSSATRTGATSSCSTSTSTGTTAPASVRPTRRGGPGSSPR